MQTQKIEEMKEQYNSEEEELNEVWDQKVEELKERICSLNCLNGKTKYGFKGTFQIEYEDEKKDVEVRFEDFGRRKKYAYIRMEGKYLFGNENVSIETIRQGVKVLKGINEIIAKKIQKAMQGTEDLKKEVAELQIQ